MARVKRGVTAKARHRKILEMAEGMQGARHRLYKNANEAVMHSLAYAYRDRKQRKGEKDAPSQGEGGEGRGEGGVSLLEG